MLAGEFIVFGGLIFEGDFPNYLRLFFKLFKYAKVLILLVTFGEIGYRSKLVLSFEVI